MPDDDIDTTGTGADDDSGGGSDTAAISSKTYTKSEVDGMVSKAIKKARSEFADYARLKEESEELAQVRASALTTEQKLAKQVTDLTGKLTAADTRARTALLRSAIMVEASRQGAVDPEAVAQLLPKDDVVIDEDGEVEGVKEAVTALLASKPYLAAAGTSRRRAGVEMQGGGEGGVRVLQSTHREWLRTGQMTPERTAMVEKAMQEGHYVLGK